MITLKNRMYIRKNLSACADNFITGQRHLHYVGVHTADAVFGREDIVFLINAFKGFRVRNLNADGHDLVRPVCFRVDHGEIPLVKNPARLKIGADLLFCDGFRHRTHR